MIPPISLIACILISTFAASSPLENAENLYRAGKYSSALESAATAVKEAEAASDTTELIKALCVSTDIAVELGDDAFAAECYNRCFDLTHFGEPMFMLASSLYNLAMIYYQNGEYDKAEEYVSKSISIDSQRASDSVLALKYLLAARISYDKGDYARALELAGKGESLAERRRNVNVLGRLTFLETLCLETMAGDNPDWARYEEGYRSALEILSRTAPGNYYGAVNPYAGEILYHLGLAVDAQGKDGKPYLEEAIKLSGTSQKMRGVNPTVTLDCCKSMSSILLREGDESGAARYAAKADSLSFVPYVKEMSTNLSLSQMEFIRREKDRQIEMQKEKTLYSIILAAILAAGLIGLLLLYRRIFLQKKSIEEKNTQLIKLMIQKDKMLNMVKDSSLAQSVRSNLDIIAKDTVPLPEIKLTKRETQILYLCCKGMASKEIATALNISVRTVESHKSSIFQKTGINSTGELITFALKSGLVK